MRRRVKLFIATGAAGAMLVVGVAAPSVAAAPITCPNGQEAAHVNGHWYCQNGGENESGAGHHKGTGEKIH